MGGQRRDIKNNIHTTRSCKQSTEESAHASHACSRPALRKNDEGGTERGKKVRMSRKTGNTDREGGGGGRKMEREIKNK